MSSKLSSSRDDRNTIMDISEELTLFCENILAIDGKTRHTATITERCHKYLRAYGSARDIAEAIIRDEPLPEEVPGVSIEPYAGFAAGIELVVRKETKLHPEIANMEPWDVSIHGDYLLVRWGSCDG